MGKTGAVAMLMLAGFAFLDPARASWAYVAVVALFEAWLSARMRTLGNGRVAAGEPPYHFSADEAELVTRYRFYFTYPALARDCASVLAAAGLSALVLTLWLTYKQAFVQAVLVGVNLFAVGWFTRRVAPLAALRLAAARGSRDALRSLEAHDPAWAKIRAANEPPAR